MISQRREGGEREGIERQREGGRVLVRKSDESNKECVYRDRGDDEELSTRGGRSDAAIVIDGAAHNDLFVEE